MKTRAQLIEEFPYAAASNGKAAVMVMEINGIERIWTYSPKSLGEPKNRLIFEALFARAIEKMRGKSDGSSHRNINN